MVFTLYDSERVGPICLRKRRLYSHSHHSFFCLSQSATSHGVYFSQSVTVSFFSHNMSLPMVYTSPSQSQILLSLTICHFPWCILLSASHTFSCLPQYVSSHGVYFSQTRTVSPRGPKCCLLHSSVVITSAPAGPGYLISRACSYLSGHRHTSPWPCR
jgi:hypothetical protein